MKNINGIFAINKPIGITSQRAVQIVKYWARRKTGDKKIKVGHAGTLDPLASGVLVIGIGREYTKDLEAVVLKEKEYIADIFLGTVSETDDAEGKKTVINKNKKPTEVEIEGVIKNFIGKIEQIPSKYSAIKIDGEEAYKRARRGEDVEMKKRRVRINEIEVLSYAYPSLKIRVKCGKGTYIRSLARDIGEKLETGAYLSGLTRTRVGDFVLDGAKSLDDFCMNIAVHASELDEKRIDGTRVYISEILNRFGDMAKHDKFHIYHQGEFNKDLAPPKRGNYFVKKLSRIPFWTQTRFAWHIFKTKPDVLWMPLHNAPFLRSKKTRVIVTIHDLAFKFFPETFPKSDLKKLNILTDHAVKIADHIITVSKSTKRDLLKFYPHLSEDNITTVHHGVDEGLWRKKSESVNKAILKQYNLLNSEYIIHTGSIQPRKNLITLIKAFDKAKENEKELKLVLVGGEGWLAEETRKVTAESKNKNDIIFTGNISFESKCVLMQNAKVFVLPSLYEGFGIAGLESLAAGTAIVAARNSSLPEVLGDAAIYFDAHDIDGCSKQIERMLNDESMRAHFVQKGKKRISKFTWDKCARDTLRVLRS